MSVLYIGYLEPHPQAELSAVINTDYQYLSLLQERNPHTFSDGILASRGCSLPLFKLNPTPVGKDNN